jgi:hypothetical protein
MHDHDLGLPIPPDRGIEPGTVPRLTARRRTLIFLPPAAALCYPFLLQWFHLCVTQRGLEWVALDCLLLLAAIIAPPVTGIYAYRQLGVIENPSPTDLQAKAVALASVAAAPLYTTLGVLLTIAHNPVSDFIVWIILWVVAGTILLWPKREILSSAQPKMPTWLPRLRYAHGVSAALIICIFLAMHLINHLSALWSLETQRLLMSTFRHIYRAGFIEPLLVALMVFQVATGPVLVWQYIRQPSDLRRTLQIASGAYLLFFVPGHMNSVFVYARAIANIPTDWNFATGAPTGILLDAWNIRLLPHYLLGVFFVITHLILGARGISLAHHMSLRTADRLSSTGIAGAAILAIAILLGMIGVHFV